MKKGIVTLVGCLVLFGWVTLSCAQEAQAGALGGKVGFVDLSRLFDEYKKTEEYDKQLEKKREAKQGEREKIVKEIKGLQDKVSLLNDKEKEKTQGKIDEQVESLKNFDQLASMDLRKERDEFLKEILKEIQETINEYAKKESYTLIFNDRVLLFGDPAIDITEQLLKAMNEKYAKKK